MRPETGGEYIRKHTEEQDQSKVEQAKERLSIPFGEVVYADSGSERIENYPYAIEFSYGSLPENTDPILVNNKGLKVEAKHFRLLKYLNIKRVDKNVELKLSDIIPEDCTVLISPDRTDDSWNSIHNPNNHRIIVGGDITKPEYILHLLHEAGHAHIANNLDRDEKFKSEINWRKNADQGQIARKLLEERDSHAFALKKFRPFMDKEGTGNFSIIKDDCLALMHEWALLSYYEEARNLASLNQSMHHFAMDYWEDWMDDGKSVGSEVEE